MQRTLRSPVKKRSGFTAVEMLLVMGLMTVTAGLVVPTIRQYEMSSDIETATQNLVQAIRTAELMSQSGKYDTAWGVYVPDGVLFAGDSYTLRTEGRDTVFPIPGGIEIHGSTELTFARVTGLPENPGELCIESTTSNGHRLLTIDENGLVTAGSVNDGSCSSGTTGTMLAANITPTAAAPAQDNNANSSSAATNGAAASNIDSSSMWDTWSSNTAAVADTTSSWGMNSSADMWNSSTGYSSSWDMNSSTSSTDLWAMAYYSDMWGISSSYDMSASNNYSSSMDMMNSASSDMWNSSTGYSSSWDMNSSTNSSFTSSVDPATSSAANSSTSTNTDPAPDPTPAPIPDPDPLPDPIVPCYLRFSVDQSKGTLDTIGTNDVTVRVLDASGTYGDKGPALNVTASVSTDNGITWSAMNAGRALKGGEITSIDNLAQGKKIVLNIQGRYSWLFSKTFRSDAGDGHIVVLRSGDALPNYTKLKTRALLPVSLLPFIDSTGHVTIGSKSLLLLTELGVLDPEISDFRDATILVTFQEKVGTCTDGLTPKVAIHFDRLENMGTGNATPMIYAGPGQLPFTEDQLIPLVDDNGTMIIDEGMVEDVPGLALERGDGWIHILSYGSHELSSGKEVIDAAVQLKNATITGIQNDTDPDASESPRDGRSDDTSSGDEFVPSLDGTSVVFKTRVITDNDGIFIEWKPNALMTTAGMTDVQVTEEPAIVDPCAAPFTIDQTNLVTLGENADVTVRTVSVDATLNGDGGPRINVRGQLSTDGGALWKPLWDNRVLSGDETTALNALPAGTRLGLGFTGRYSSTFNRSALAGQTSDALRIVKPGDIVEELRVAKLRGTLSSTLKNFVNADGTLVLGPRDIAMLIDMGDGPVRTYHDAVAVITIEKSPHGNACLVAASSSSTSSSSSQAAPAIIDTDGDGIDDQVDLCPGTVIPEATPSQSLLFDRFALRTADAAGTVPVFRKGPEEQLSEYTIDDTRGCSCSQILDTIETPSKTNLIREAVVYQQLKNIFSFYVDTARKFGCPQALLRIVAGH